MSALSRQARPKHTWSSATLPPGAAGPDMTASAAATLAAEDRGPVPEPCIVQEICLLCVLQCFKRKALGAKQGQATNVVAKQARGCPLHLLPHKCTAPAPGRARLLSAPGSCLPLTQVPVWQEGLGQAPLPQAQPWLHLMESAPPRLQQPTEAEAQSGPTGPLTERTCC